MAGLVPAIHAAPSQRRGRHRRDQSQRLTEQGPPAVFWSCVAPNDVDGRVKPGHDAFFCRRTSFPNSAFPAPCNCLLRPEICVKQFSLSGSNPEHEQQTLDPLGLDSEPEERMRESRETKWRLSL
jgi:hypothetical protein